MALKFGTAVSPNGIAIDKEATTNTFSLKVNGGTCYGYNLFIVTTDSTPVTVFDTSVVGLATPKYDGETLNMEHNVSALTYGETYLWYVRLYTNIGLTEYITNPSYVLYADTPPTLGYTPTPSGTSPNLYYDVNGAIFTVRGTYQQAESVSVSSWYFSIYDDLQVLISQNTPTYNSNIVQEFTNLETNRTYYVDFTVTTQNDFTVTSERIRLLPDYENVPDTISPTATNNARTSGITIGWSGLVYIEGSTGTPPTYFQSGDYYYIQPNADIEFTGFIAVSEFNAMIDWGNVATTFNGDIAVLENTTTSETLTVKYNNSGTQMELYYGATLIDSISFSAPTVAPGRWLIFVDWQTIGLSNATLYITTGV